MLLRGSVYFGLFLLWLFTSSQAPAWKFILLFLLFYLFGLLYAFPSGTMGTRKAFLPINLKTCRFYSKSLSIYKTSSNVNVTVVSVELLPSLLVAVTSNV
jgi:hypothetical protein